MNPLEKWRSDFWSKVRKIVAERGLSEDEIPDFFLYDNLRSAYPDFCPLFAENKLCHTGVEREKFCCLLCACPFYDYAVWDEENKIFGACKRNSPLGHRTELGYWDCSACAFVHDIRWVKAHKNLWRNLGEGK